jgi:hypothetical protein
VVAENKTVPIDLGYCPEWTLQRGIAHGAEFVRCVDDAEFHEIMNAAAFCRQYLLNPPSRLLMSSYKTWSDLIVKVNDQATSRLSYELSGELQSSFVGWLLIWRLVFDQADHNICTRFGKESTERSQLKTARSDAYDTHRGYRVVESMRNLVQHQEMPPFNASLSRILDRSSGNVVRNIDITFPVSWLLESPKCAAKVRSEFKENPEELLSAADIVDDAMAGFQKVFLVITKMNYPELVKSVNLVRAIFREAHPGGPGLLRAKKPLAGSRIQGGVDLEIYRLEDLLKVVLEAPIGIPYRSPGTN